MFVSRVILKNWKNFLSVDIAMGQRVFIVGPNASGKSNFLDVFRFLRDITKDNGSLQSAINDRGGLGKIRCLAARQSPDVEIEVHLSDSVEQPVVWKYSIGIKTETGGARKPIISFEKVWRQDTLLLDRPNNHPPDKEDRELLRYTHLEQVTANKDFRDIASFFNTVTYLHLVPQLVRHAGAYTGPGVEGDPFGRSFLERISRTNEKTRGARLKRIEELLTIAVPQLEHLRLKKDEDGHPHLEATYKHWRSQGALQREDQFSDGTLRLIGLLWSLQEGDSLLLLEEPELSLHNALVAHVPAIIYKIHKLLKKKQRQIIISTHSYELLSDRSIGGNETLLIAPSQEGSEIKTASSIHEVALLLRSGMSVADAALPQTAPENLQQLSLFD
jgi:predicted ATPase